MIKHVIMWQLKDELSDEQKVQIKADAKEKLEALVGKIPGLVEMKIQTEYFKASNADFLLDSTFESREALEGYAVHPEHVKIADENVRPFVKYRSCLDFEV